MNFQDKLKKTWLGSWFGRPNTVKLSILCNLICKFNTVPIKIPVELWFFLVELHKLILKYVGKHKGQG